MSFTPTTLLRQWETLRLVPLYPRKISISEIRVRLENNGYSITTRSLQRDLKLLSTVFPLLVDEVSKPYGWSWSPDAKTFNLPGLSLSQALTILMARDHLKHVMPASSLGEMASMFKAAESMMNALQEHTSIATWRNKVRVLPAWQSLIPPAVDSKIQNAIYEALLADKQCHVAYQKRNSTDVDDYPISPLGLVQKGQVFYLVCTIKEYPDIKLLALHRIKQAEVTNNAKITPNGFDLDAYIQTAAFGWFPSDDIILEVVFASDAGSHLRDSPLSDDQFLENMPDGRLYVRATVKHTRQLTWWLLGFGDLVQVIGPAKLRIQMIDTINNMAKSYA